MDQSRYKRFWLLALLGVLAASCYPIYMAVKVLLAVCRNGFVPIEDYPKYIIPYVPIALALIVGVCVLPLFQKRSRKLDLLFGSILTVLVFFITERLMETKILVQTKELVPLESWQMSLCYIPPEQYRTRTWAAVDILLGGYRPAFKLHFYLISVVIILSVLNCIYGFAGMIRSGDRSRKKALSVQSAAALAFLGMCIWACFTAFYRSGELTVSALSAVLMAVFFALLGVTAGVFSASFTLQKRKALSVILPTVVAGLTTIIMYVGEMILLSGHLYRFGSGFFFDGLGRLVLAPADVCVILLSGLATLLICAGLNRATVSHNPDLTNNRD